MFSLPISVIRFIALRGERAHKKTCHIHNTGKTLYIWIETLLHLENKQIIPNNVETQHNHMYSLLLCIGSLCNITFPMPRFTCIVTS